MTDEEQKTKKVWLAVFLTSLGWNVGNNLIGLITRNGAFEDFMKISPWLGWSIGFFFPLLFASIQYHCCYKKPGTRWLTLLLVALPLSLLGTACSWIFLPPDHPALRLMAQQPVYFTISSLLSVIFLIQCWKLRRVNKRLQKA